MVEELRAYLAPGLEAAGDTGRVAELWREFDRTGNGADRQRRWYREQGWAGLAEHLVGSTVTVTP